MLSKTEQREIEMMDKYYVFKRALEEILALSVPMGYDSGRSDIAKIAKEALKC